MGFATGCAALPYLMIPLKAAGLVRHAATGMAQFTGAALVYAVVTIYVIIGGVRGVGWTNVIQGLAMLIVVWGLGLWIPIVLYGSIDQMFDRIVATAPLHLT